MKTPITAKDAKERALLNIKPYTKIPDHIFTGIYGAIGNGQLETYFMVPSFEVVYIDDLHKLGYTTDLRKYYTDKDNTEFYIRLTIAWRL